MKQTMVFPITLQKEIERAVKILKEAGCSEIFLFGSSISGKMKESSDIDLAIRGCPPGSFFKILGRLICSLNRPVDLINLDAQEEFARLLEKEGELLRID